MEIKKIGIYLLPNILTTLGLFAGFYAIILAINNNFVASSVAIFIAMLLDGLDGRVARLTNTYSSFGEQYDSMADLLSFGVAPALLCYFYITVGLNQTLGNLTYIAVFIYIAGTSLRLARFNAQINHISKNYFQGLPSPTAAAFITALIWFCNTFSINQLFSDITFATILLMILVMLGVLMVSNIRYYSFKNINFSDKTSFKKLLLLIATLVLILLYPSLMIFTFSVVYVLSGIIFTLKQISKKRHKKLL